MPMIGDYTEQQYSDMLHRDRARAMAAALDAYARDMGGAVRSSRTFGDDRSADQYRAYARAHLHPYPELLAMVEPQPLGLNVVTSEAVPPGVAFIVPGGAQPTRASTADEAENWARGVVAIVCDDDPIIGLVERVGEWTGR